MTRYLASTGHMVEVYKALEARGGANARWAWRCTCGTSDGTWGFKSTAIGSAQAHINHKEITMTTIDSLIRRRDYLDARIARLAALPPEPLTDDANVIWFEKTFGTEQAYTYAAVRAGDGRWYTTGPRTPKAYTWQELIEWIGPDAQVWLATEWEQL